MLREVMLETSTTQSELSRLSGVRQPSISGFLSGKVDLSDDQLDRLLSCMGFRSRSYDARRPQADPLRTPLVAVHRRLSTMLNRQSFEDWRPTIERNLDRLDDA